MAQVITYKNNYADSLIAEFSEDGGAFHPQVSKIENSHFGGHVGYRY